VAVRVSARRVARSLRMGALAGGLEIEGLDADVHPWPATTRGAADNRSPSASAGSLARSRALESFLGS
jgi:hypothetical protein